jgi:predicted unusual protein kinase regulating ubiquinone biosynthesis (AarF/ABC1/UbiB family)
MLRSGSICMSFLYNYLTSESESQSENGGLEKNCQKLKCLSKTFESYGGVLSKLSQILSLNNEKSEVFSDCKPFSKEKTIEYFKQNCSENLENVDYEVYKSGSVGQVHKAMYKNKKVIVKVQYVGLKNQTENDLKMLDTIISYIYHFADMKTVMVDVKTKLYEELDYKLEANNQNLIYKIYKKNPFIQIPKVIKKLSTDKMICMNYVEGRSLKEFIDNSTQSERNIFGLCVVKFIFETLYNHSILYSDIHYGNLLVKKNNTLCVLDFGCIHKIEEKLLDNMKKLHKSLDEKNKESFYKLVEDIGIINTTTISEKSKEYIYEYFLLQYTPWIVDDFEFTEEWLDKCSCKNTELMKEWILPQNMVYFNKIPYGAYHIFTKLKLKGQFREIINNILN